MKKWKHNITLILLGLLSLSIIACTDKEYKYGRGYDAQRTEKKIPIVGEKAYTSDDWAYWWKYPIKEKGHRYKSVKINNNEIVYEFDEYESGIRYVTNDGRHGEEYIQITYSYENEKAGLNPWSAVYYYKDGKHDMNLAEAEKKLNSWGVERLAK